jgi:putative transcriptional regulator
MTTASLRGQLLVASPALLDPNFRRAVVLVVAHDEDGALGLVLNRRTEAEVAEALPELAELVEPGAVVSLGGPVQNQAVVVLAEWDDPDEAGAMVFDQVGLMGSETESDRVAAATRRVRVFAGYAGWGGGQLEAELEEPSWIVESADVEDVFAEEGDLWSAVLRRKGGAFKLVATMPENPSLN